MATQQSELDDGYDLGPTPEDIAASESNQYNKEITTGNSVQRNMANIARGSQIASGGGPQMARAQNVQQRLQAILSDVNQGTDPNEDPLTKQMRLAKALSVGMIDVAPQIALQANQQAQRIAQAQQQQKLLSTQQQQAQANLTQTEFKDRVQQLTGQIVFAKKGADGGMEAYDTVNPSDPDYQTKVAQIQAKAAQDNVQVIPMTADSFINGRNAVAQTQAQARMYAADQANQARMYASDQSLQAALLRAQNSGHNFSGNQAMMTKRIMSSVALGAGALTNIAEMPFGATTGNFFGMGAAPGESVFKSSFDSLRNQVTDLDKQRYQAVASQLERNIALVEAQGGLQGGQQMSKNIAETLKFRPGDQAMTVLTKLADVRRIFEDGTKIPMADPAVPQELKEVMNQSLNELRTAVPFTVHDVTSFLSAQEKDHKLTFTEYAAKKGLGAELVSPKGGDGAAPDGKISMDDGTGKIYHIPASLVDQFRQDHPNAKPLTAPTNAQ
jgi:hypothetical protein